MIDNKIGESRVAVGIVLCICGVSLGGLLKLALGVNISWLSTVIILISTLALVSFGRLETFRFLPAAVLSLFLYSIYTICLAVFGNAPLSGSNISVFYQLVYFLQILLLWGAQTRCSAERFSAAAFWIMGLGSVFALILISTKGFDVGYGVLLSRTEDTSAVSRATTGFIAFYAICSALIYQPRRSAHQIFRAAFLLAGLMVLVMSSRRSTLIAAAVAVILHVKNHALLTRIDGRKLLQRMLFAAVVIAVILVLLHTNATVGKALERAVEAMENGIKTYLGIEKSDMAASYRRATLETIPNEYLNHSTFRQFVFGRGYNVDWMDIPFMQAFWDMGLLGGIWFLFNQGLVPVRYVLRRPRNPAIEFAQYYTIFRIIQNFANGTPYGTAFPLILLYTLEAAADHTESQQTGA